MFMAKYKKLHGFLLYYSAFLSTLITVIGFLTSRTFNFFVANVLFLPVTVVLWILIIDRLKNMIVIKIKGKDADKEKDKE